jgi:hypothetical protein
MLSWTPPEVDNGSAVTSYSLYELSSGVWSLRAALGGQATSHLLEGLELGSMHRYRLRASNLIGEGAGVETEAQVADVPSQTTALSIKEGVHNITLTWSSPITDGGAAISAYVVYRAEGLGPFQILAMLAPSEHRFIDQGLTENITYRYMITAMNAMGTGPGSDLAQAAALPDPVPAGGTTEKNWIAAYQQALVGATAMIAAVVIIGAFLLSRASKKRKGRDGPKGGKL